MRVHLWIVLGVVFLAAPALGDVIDVSDGMPITLNATGTLDLGGTSLGTLSITTDTSKDASPFEDFVLTVTTADHKRFRYPFDTGYGEFRVYVPVFRDPNAIVLMTQEGHGTSASSWHLYILSVTSDGIVVKFHKVLSEFFGSGEMWWYTAHFYMPREEENPSAVIELELDHSEITHDSLESTDLIPKDSKLSILWDSKVKGYVEKQGWVSDSEDENDDDDD